MQPVDEASRDITTIPPEEADAEGKYELEPTTAFVGVVDETDISWLAAVKVMVSGAEVAAP